MLKIIKRISFIICAICLPCLLFASCQTKPTTPADVFYTISVSANEGGVVSPNGTTTIKKGNSVTVSIQANKGYFIDSVTQNGNTLQGVVGMQNYELKLNNVQANQTIVVSFYQQYTISLTQNYQNETSQSSVQYIDKYHPSIIIAQREFYQISHIVLQAFTTTQQDFTINFTENGDGSLSGNAWNLSTNIGKYIQHELGLTVEITEQAIILSYQTVANASIQVEYKAQEVSFSVMGQVFVGNEHGGYWINDYLNLSFNNYTFTYHFTFKAGTSMLETLLREITACDASYQAVGLRVMRNGVQEFISLEDIQNGRLQLTNENAFEVVYESV